MVRQADARSGPALFFLIWDSRLKKYYLAKSNSEGCLEMCCQHQAGNLRSQRCHVLHSIPRVHQGAFITVPKSLCLKRQSADEIHVNPNWAGRCRTGSLCHRGDYLGKPDPGQQYTGPPAQPMGQWILVICFHSPSSSLDIR